MDLILFPASSVQILAAIVLLWAAYLSCLGSYRLFISPLAKFPGPKLAGLTKWYEFYYDIVLPGQFTFQIQKLHKLYGRENIHHNSIISNCCLNVQSFALPLSRSVSMTAVSGTRYTLVPIGSMNMTGCPVDTVAIP